MTEFIGLSLSMWNVGLYHEQWQHFFFYIQFLAADWDEKSIQSFS
ncbi:hypothetical protein SLEP1_g33717 [Rubroshorea leprosula]|uniref:Uncharacterized protein n=1 Tax=Rubroshorea leprosula TaxID=152421 RepID=A0AAV5KHJ1_9ROSI|nr:hypothetical protein SLEP1_g33717 [Rubroshorea leprosula]